MFLHPTPVSALNMRTDRARSLDIARHEVRHAVSGDIAELDQRGGRKHVKNHLLGCSRFEPG